MIKNWERVKKKKKVINKRIEPKKNLNYKSQRRLRNNDDI